MAGPEPHVVGIVVAAGGSTRLGGSVPKQFLPLGGRSVVSLSIEAIARVGVGVVAVLPADDVEGPRGRAIAASPGVRRIVAGGSTRARSVREGLYAAPGATHVLVHDAARPLVPAAVVEAVLGATLRHGAAVPVVPVADTVKAVGPEEFVERTLDRASLCLAQTPQGARADWLAEALDAQIGAAAEPTDEAQALERAGRRVAIVPGDRRNLKITGPDDLDEARRRMGESASDLRVGSGFDVHRFSPSRELVLGGVRFPGEPGLEGHSDADVVLHAAMDALLGAAGLGDIGLHFPPGDRRFAGADSAALAARVASLVRNGGWEVLNVDLTLLAERPKIVGRRDEMREAIAAALGVDPSRVGLKATTLEGLGALGRGEGAACQATALLRRAGGGA